MKFLSILAAVSLALAPVIASAGSSGDSTDNGRPISGPLAGRVLAQPIPVGAVIVGSMVVLGGVVIALVSGGGSSTVDTTPTTTTPN